MAEATLAEKRAAAYFAENPEVDTVLATSDGNAWPVAQVNLATHHALENALEPPEELERGDLTAEIVLAESDLVVQSGRKDASAAVEYGRALAYELAKAEFAAILEAGYAELMETFGADLGKVDEEVVPAELGLGDLTMTRNMAILATWLRSGLSIEDFQALSEEDRTAAVASEFPDFMIPEDPGP